MSDLTPDPSPIDSPIPSFVVRIREGKAVIMLEDGVPVFVMQDLLKRASELIATNSHSPELLTAIRQAVRHRLMSLYDAGKLMRSEQGRWLYNA